MRKQKGTKFKGLKKLIIKYFTSGVKINAIAYKLNLSAERVRILLLDDSREQYQKYRQLHKDNITDGMLKKFLECTKKLNRIPTPFEARRYGVKFNDQGFKRFSQVAMENGFVHEKHKKSNMYSDMELIEHLKLLARKLGHTPSVKEIKKDGTYSHITYRNRFGSLTKAHEMAGLTPNPRGGSHERSLRTGKYISKEDCLKDLERITFKLGRFPTNPDIIKYGKYCYDTYRKRFGGMKMNGRHLDISREKEVA